MAIITVSSEVAAYGTEFSERLADRYFAEFLRRDDLIERFIRPIATEKELRLLTVSPRYYLAESAAGISFDDYLRGALHELAARSSLVLCDLGAQFYLEDLPSAVHIRLVAERDFRRQRFVERNLDLIRRTGAEELRYRDLKIPANADFGEWFERIEKLERRFFSTVFGGRNEEEPTLYDAVFNTSRLSFEAMFKLVDELLIERNIQEQLELYGEGEAESPSPHYFELKNESEREFARLLDLYGLEWRYEPKTFPVEWDEDGRVSLAFSPDFYLPRFDLFIELTTMNQKYVRLKKKKAKRLTELYPGIRCKVVYKRDFEALFKRFEATADPSTIGDER